VNGTTAADAADAALLPTTLAATTLNVYDVPLARPTTVQVKVSAGAVHVFEPGVDVTV